MIFLNGKIKSGFKPPGVSPLQSDLLDLSRWLAAMLVVVEHLRSLMFADYSAGAGVLEKLFYFFTGFGHTAVMIFFVMSGFLVGGKVLERMAAQDFSWLKYGVDRASRLYAVYGLALVLGGALDWLGWHYFNRAGFYDMSFSGRIAIINHDFHQNLSARLLLINLAMCQTILGPVFGSNGPLWSLANEFWYYLAGPVLFLFCFGRKFSTRVFSLAGTAVLVWFLPRYILVYSLVWLLGAGLYFVNHRRLVPLPAALLLLAASLVVNRLQLLHLAYAGDFSIAVAFALTINAATGSARRLLVNDFSRRMAGFSYSTYLCHFPFVAFVLSVAFQQGWLSARGQPRPVPMLVFLLILLATCGWCYLISLVTERQTGRIRTRLNRLLGAPVWHAVAKQ